MPSTHHVARLVCQGAPRVYPSLSPQSRTHKCVPSSSAFPGGFWGLNWGSSCLGSQHLADGAILQPLDCSMKHISASCGLCSTWLTFFRADATVLPVALLLSRSWTDFLSSQSSHPWLQIGFHRSHLCEASTCASGMSSSILKHRVAITNIADASPLLRVSMDAV